MRLLIYSSHRFETLFKSINEQIFDFYSAECLICRISLKTYGFCRSKLTSLPSSIKFQRILTISVWLHHIKWKIVILKNQMWENQIVCTICNCNLSIRDMNAKYEVEMNRTFEGRTFMNMGPFIKYVRLSYLHFMLADTSRYNEKKCKIEKSKIEKWYSACTFELFSLLACTGW